MLLFKGFAFAAFSDRALGIIKIMRRNLLILTIILFVCSCDCYNRFEGFVFDLNTKKPIFNVNISALSDGIIINDFGWVTDTLRMPYIKNVKANDTVKNSKDISKQYRIESFRHSGPLMTDSNGFFKIGYLSGSCISLRLIAIKKGYKSIITKEFHSNRDTIKIYLTKNE
jgi:hypothetical protein